ncbi:histidine kinase [Sphaerotilus natans subsp. natans DSM 6575]|uniref:C4-dicarboxylate transport sensor protein DctB n=1 Tax=Sphaerotilus natans subsp. natans DSM 6575 TaxID=1286631 RepID=A0A059KJ06_9BURK|nr:ATP-binding protein [Sphaerotilus natans]KDB51447.1 histidine kinase [Sphaerotilus natans subsp. natans DSM 6575]SIR66217.1 two-component system, NtrC family, C4-dicarboxylate transport sensor histidine kinase DctB [Sphaerotilus natans]
MITSSAPSRLFGPRRPLWPAVRQLAGVLLALLTVLAAGWSGFVLSERHGLALLRDDADHRLDLFASAAQGAIRRLEHIPATIQLNREVQALLLEPHHALRVSAANSYLRRLNAHLGSLAVFVLDERGIVVATSSDQTGDDSQLGEDLSFRPYFQEALSGQVGRHFAIGARTHQPGYFVSHPIRDGARVVGVATIKISLEPIEQMWEMLGAPALLADTNRVVILSSRPEWRYTTLSDPTLEQRVEMQITRLYDEQPLPRFPVPLRLVDGAGGEGVEGGEGDVDSEEVDGVLPPGLLPAEDGQRPARTSALVLGRALDGMDWRLMIFPDLRVVRNQAVLHSMLSAVAVGFVLLLTLFLNQRRRSMREKLEAKQLLERANAELEHKVARRTRALTDTNARLRREIAEREQAERTLREAHDELVHAGKMAALGQLATGITHELAQPLGAIRTLAGNAVEFQRRGDQKAVSGNLGIITRLADQMGQIIQPLKGFARKSAAVPAATDVAHAVANALFLYDQRLRREGVEVRNLCVPGEVVAWCDPNRLEQVLINLIGNAADAMKDSPVRRLLISAGPDAAARDGEPPLRLDVVDSGPGVPESVRARLFEPFFTTKEAGVGLGLGLAISRDIVREFHGELEASNCPEGGACFTLRLPLPPGEATADPDTVSPPIS